MSAGRSGRGELADVMAGGGGKSVVIVCFTPRPGAQCETALGFLDEVSRSCGGRVLTASISQWGDSELAREFAAEGTVTLLLLVDGKEVARSVGEGGETMMRKMIERHAGAAGRPSKGWAPAAS